MTEQQQRIAVGAVIISLLPYLPGFICKHLGDCEQSKKSAMFAIGKKLGKLVSVITKQAKKTVR